MSRVRVAAPMLAALLLVAHPHARQSPSAVDALLSQYAAEDRRAFAERLPTESAFRALRAELFQKTRDWRQQWTPSGPTFLLDLAAWGLERSWVDAPQLIRTAADIVVRRTAPIGTVPAQDAYEILFHRTALSLLSGQKLFTETDRYLDVMKLRVAARKEPGPAMLLDARLPLTDAFLTDLRTAPGIDPNDDAVVTPGAGGTRATVAPSGRWRQNLQRAAAVYAPLVAVSDIGDEARVRRAFVLYRLGQYDEGLALLSQPVPDGDSVLRYWRGLFRGRLLDALDRADEATRAYEEAAMLYPGSPTPALALAVLFQRRGDQVRAEQSAATARRGDQVAADPWLQYWAGDLRFFLVWIAELRKAHP